MNSKITKYGAASFGAASLFATAISLGGGGGPSEVADASRAARRDRVVASLDRSLSGSPMGSSVDARSPFADAVETFLLSTRGDRFPTALEKLGSGDEPTGSTGSSPTDTDEDSVTITIPRQVTVTMPTYEGGRAPQVTPPTYKRGTDPAVEQDGRKVVIDPGQSGTWTAPDADPGELGTFTPPQVTVA